MAQTSLPAPLWEALQVAKEIYRRNKTLTLVSQGEGRIWANKIYFAEEDGYLYGLLERPTEGRGHHYSNILRDPRVFFVIDRGVPDRFLQGEGIIEILGDVAERPERHILFRKVPQAVLFAKFFPLFVFRIRPTRLYISDYTEEWKPRVQVEVTEEVLQAFQSPLKSRPNPWRIYWQAVRSFAFPVTISPLLLGAFLAPSLSWPLLLLTLVGALLAHAAINVLSDYFDYRRGADTWSTLGSSRVLLDGLMEPGHLLRFGLLLLLAAGVGLALTAWRGFPSHFVCGPSRCFPGDLLYRPAPRPQIQGLGRSGCLSRLRPPDDPGLLLCANPGFGLAATPPLGASGPFDHRHPPRQQHEGSGRRCPGRLPDDSGCPGAPRFQSLLFRSGADGLRHHRCGRGTGLAPCMEPPRLPHRPSGVAGTSRPLSILVAWPSLSWTSGRPSYTSSSASCWSWA